MQKQIRMSRKNAKHIANLVNSITVWATAVTRATEPQKMREFMQYHDNYATELNALLGVEAAVPYVTYSHIGETV